MSRTGANDATNPNELKISGKVFPQANRKKSNAILNCKCALISSDRDLDAQVISYHEKSNYAVQSSFIPIAIYRYRA